MEKLLPCALAEVTDSLLHDAVLEVGIDPTKGKTLSLDAATVLDSLSAKSVLAGEKLVATYSIST
jgi:hypothetical protein